MNPPRAGAADVAHYTGAALKGRGAATNPANRFERLQYEADGDDLDALAAQDADDAAGNEASRRRARTLYLRDPSRTILSHNESPDVPFDVGLNPYRGCEHGCIYCYARPTHEYLGFSAGLDFETRILVKENAPELLREALRARKWQPQLIGLSGVTDPFQPIERKMELTRGCLEVLLEARNPVGVITKNALVARDADLLGELARFEAASVNLSITTLDGELQRSLEPRTSHPRKRLEAISALAEAGVPVGVMVAPVIPGLNDHEIPSILRAAAEAGASRAGYLIVRLPHGVAPLFESWLETHRPERAARVLAHLRSMRGGGLDDPRFGSRMRGQGQLAANIAQLFDVSARRAGLRREHRAKSTQHFRRPSGDQLQLF